MPPVPRKELREEQPAGSDRAQGHAQSVTPAPSQDWWDDPGSTFEEKLSAEINKLIADYGSRNLLRNFSDIGYIYLQLNVAEQDSMPDDKSSGGGLPGEIVRIIDAYGFAAVAAEVAKHTPSRKLSLSPLSRTVLDTLGLKERHDALCSHYKDHEPWTDRRNPPFEAFQKWADTELPDRVELGLLFEDLGYIDKAAYRRLALWRATKLGRIPSDMFGFPLKREVHNELIASGHVPDWSEVQDAINRDDPRAGPLRAMYMANRARGRQIGPT